MPGLSSPGWEKPAYLRTSLFSFYSIINQCLLAHTTQRLNRKATKQEFSHWGHGNFRVRVQLGLVLVSRKILNSFGWICLQFCSLLTLLRKVVLGVVLRFLRSFSTSWETSLQSTMVFVFCIADTLLFAWEINLIEESEGRRHSNYSQRANAHWDSQTSILVVSIWNFTLGSKAFSFQVFDVTEDRRFLDRKRHFSIEKLSRGKTISQPISQPISQNKTCMANFW